MKLNIHENLKKIISTRNIVLISLFIIVGLLPLMINTGYVYRLLFFFSLYIALAQAYNLIAGYTGQYSFGNAVFFGIGAYGVASVWMLGTWYTGMSIGMIVGIAVAILVSLIHLPLFRLVGMFFAMGTLFVNEVLKAIMLRWDAIGGVSGIVLSTHGTYNLPAACYLTYFFSIVVIFLIYEISNAKIGYAFKTVRENEVLAESMGIHPLKYKALAFAINALIIAIAGGIFAYVQLFIEPSSVFDIDWSLLPCYMMMIGGKGTVWGPVIGAVFYTTLLEAVSGLRELQMLFFGAVVILVVLFTPHGLYGMFETLSKLIKGEKKLGEVLKVFFQKVKL